MISFSSEANGIVDAGLLEEDKQISAFIRGKSNYFLTYNSGEPDSIGLAYGVQLDSGFVLVGADDENAFVRGFYRRPKAEWGADFGISDTLENTDLKFDVGVSYYLVDDFAVVFKTDFDKVFFGVRRWL